MSAIAGCLARPGRGIDEERLGALGHALRQLGPDSERRVRRGDLVMLHRAFHVDSDSRLTEQPFEAEDGDLLSFDGRLDNAGEIARRLEVPIATPSVRLLHLAYRRWGLAVLRSLVGDFAFALWDAGARRLLLCCDAMGRRPLYYHRSDGRVLWCSRARPLVAAAALPEAVDEEYLADFLANRVPDRAPYRGVDVVPGGHVLVVDGVKVEMVRYWAPDPSYELRYRSDSEYEEHFAELFREAVACRLQADRPVYCELSGGVDSSTIACVADRLVRDRAVAAPALRTVSYVFAGSATADETPFVEAIEQQVGARASRISDEDCPLLAPIPDALACDVPTNGLWVLSRYDHLARVMAREQSRVLLSGIGGDQLFWSEYTPGLALADLVVQGRARAALRHCVAVARLRRRSAVEIFWRGACRPLLPRSWQARLGGDAPVGEWFTRAFARRTALAERMLPMPDDLGFRLPTSRLQYGYIRRTMRPFALDPCLTDAHFDARYPYLDRRLVEFALAIPLDQKARPAESRSIVRRGLAGAVPSVVLQRRSKAGPEEAFYRALIREWPWLSRLLTEPRLADLGLVDRDRFARAVERARHGSVTHQAQLAWTISLELWLRQLELRPAPAGAPRAAGAISDRALVRAWT